MVNKKILKKILDFSDKYSYDIYICHMLFVKGILSLINITPYFAINIFLALLAIVISGIILKTISSFVQSKINNLRIAII